MEFKSNGKVIIRDLSSLDASVSETTFAIDKGTVRIQEFKLASHSSAIEFSMLSNTLISASGLRFTNDISGKTYTPAERLAEAKRISAEAEKQRLERLARQEQRARAEEQKAIEATKRAEADVQKEVQAMEQRDAEKARLAASVKQAEEEKARTIEKAKRYAAEHLPLFTNQIVTLTDSDNTTYSNICLTRASLDGVVYRFTDAVGGGCIAYPKLGIETLAALNIDTNMIAVSEERAVIQAEILKQYKELLAREGAAAANAYRKEWNTRLGQYSARDAFNRRYGLNR